MIMDVANYLAEDIETVDITSEILLSEEKGKAVIIAKRDCVIAGLEEAMEIFNYLGLDLSSETIDGGKASKGDVIITIQGRAKDILAGERLALNFLSRMSGIATETRRLVDRCKKINPDVQIAATRKTTPGFREFEKKAVVLGGGHPHRMGLSDAFLIKDNHLKLVPSIKEAVLKAKESEYAKQGRKVEIEVDSQEDAILAVEAGADIVMLDNMDPKMAEEAYIAIKKMRKDVIVEISGGITPENIEEFANHADMISLGYLTHSVKAMDFSLEIV